MHLSTTYGRLHEKLYAALTILHDSLCAGEKKIWPAMRPRKAKPRTAGIKTIVLAMKLTIFLLTVCMLRASATGYSQQITFSGKNVSLEKIFTVIEQQTGYVVFYNYSAIRDAKSVTVNAKQTPLKKFLEDCFADQPYKFVMEGKTISVTREEAMKPGIEMQVVIPPTSIDVTGRVTNTGGEPLAGASVVIRRTGKGVIADANGQFKLRDVSSDDIIVVSFIGYKTLDIKVGDRTNFILVMEVADNKLDEMVVQAYGKTTQRLATGSISRITSEDISKQPVMNVLNVLQGQIPGAVVTNASGYASGTVKVEIRGRNTINSNFPSDPLYIIDGVPLTILDISNTDSYAGGSQGVIRSGIYSPASGQSPLFSVNPADIESIEVLKDADATAIYGSRGSNGVILITTKKGKAGKTLFDIKVHQGFEKITSRYKVLNTSQYVAMRKEALSNDGLPLTISRAPDLVAWDTTKYTDWQKFLFGGTGKTTNVETVLSGGDVRTSFRIGAGFQYQTDILSISGSNKRGSFSLNLNHKSLNQKLAISFSGQYSTADIDIISIPGSPLLAPNAPDVYDSKGQLNYEGWAPQSFSYPFGNLLKPYESKTNFLNSSFDINYEIAKRFYFKINFGYGNIQADQKNLITIASQNPQNSPRGEAYFGYNSARNLIVEPQLDYNFFMGKSKVGILVGGSAQSNVTGAVFASGSGYNNDVLMSSTANAPVKYVSNIEGEYKYAGIFGRINYNFGNKYILNLNVRRDGSSKFGPGRQYGNFGSIGAAWVFTEENWVRNNIKFLSFGKIRGSYGLIGGDQISDYAYLSQWLFPNSIYNGSIPLVAINHTDSLLQWQKNKKADISILLSFFNDRINLEASLYRNRCDNQLVQFPVPSLTGFSDVISNSPANIQNTGYEISLSTKIFEQKLFGWNLKLNISGNRNKLLSYPSFSQSPFVSLYTIGKSINITKVLHYTGVNPQTGFYQFEDKDKDGSITVDFTGTTRDDRYDLDLSPKFNGGITNIFTYKNWELTVFFYFRKQIGINALAFTSVAGGMSNQPEDVYLNHWREPGDIAKYAKFTTRSSSDISFSYFSFYSDGKYTDASFIRLQNLSLGYLFPEKLVKKAGVKSAKLSIQGQNLLLITKYKGSDPELQVFGGLPKPKIITAGISCNF